jgi:hypothetical protein
MENSTAQATAPVGLWVFEEIKMQNQNEISEYIEEAAASAQRIFPRVARDPSPPTSWWKGITAWGIWDGRRRRVNKKKGLYE